TKRNAVMYASPGRAYVYFAYGNHHMLNLVCESEGVAGAVLLRALEPLVGLEQMVRRRGAGARHGLANGPGRLAQALGVDLTANGSLLGEGRLAVFDVPEACRPEVLSSGRVGLSQGHEAELRFYVGGNAHVSRAKTGPRPSAGRRKGQP
ncbi:MAG: DNA-3-methyladenine glycosylase, partial [Coriobacteriaceae bacterium]|nr:DNA-3-methyladenine glycosylase [Coriobacteriaceae bacterium]